MTPTWRLVSVLAGICMVAGFALAGVYEVTKEPIAYQKKLEIIRSLKAVAPEVNVTPDRFSLEVRRGEENIRLYRGVEEGQIAAVEFRVIAPDGYSGNIDIMMGVYPDGTLTGIEILTHAETPGLGSLITEDQWKEQFRGRSLKNTDMKVKKDGGDIDQITGATISPRAVTEAVKKGLVWFEENRAVFLKDPTPEELAEAQEPSEGEAGEEWRSGEEE